MGFNNTSYKNEKGEEIPAKANIKYRRNFYGFMLPSDSKVATDTLVTLTPDVPGATTQKIHLSGDNSKTYRFDNSGTWIPSDFQKYWIPRGREAVKNIGNQPSYWEQLKTKIGFKQEGGTMNKINYFQQGGAAPQQDIRAQVTALVQAAMQGDQKATQTVNQIMEAAKAGDQQAIQLAQMIQEIVKQMQGQATAAKYGAKLNYLQSLKCGGSAKRKRKMKKGAKVCPECEKEKIIKKNYFGGTVDKFEDGGEAKQSNKKNLRFFDRRSANIGNDRRVITETIYDYNDGRGNWLGDLAKVLGTRTIYETPKQNDTVYSYNHDPRIRLGTNTGFMGVAKQETDQNGAKTNFLQQVRTTVLPQNQNTEEAKARRRAWIEGK